MIVAVASGKGGTGKTTVAAALARIWGGDRIAVDMDVETPNLHLFLSPSIAGEQDSTLEVPVVAHPDRCNACGKCSEICAFKAIVTLGGRPVVFPDMCHACGGCLEVCGRGVLQPGKRVLGSVRWGTATGDAERDPRSLSFLMGQLNMGEAMSPPLIRDVGTCLASMLEQTGGDAIIDAPPGTSCPAMSAVRDADALVLVGEPTPFGLHDLQLAWRAFASAGKPAGVVINRAGWEGGVGDAAMHGFCRDEGLPVLAEFPFERMVAEAYAKGLSLDRASSRHRHAVAKLVSRVSALGSAAH